MFTKTLIVVGGSIAVVVAIFILGKVAEGNGDGDSTQKEKEDDVKS